MLTMTNVHALLPCALCSTRMAIPGNHFCTMCEAVTLPTVIANGIAALECDARSEPCADAPHPAEARTST